MVTISFMKFLLYGFAFLLLISCSNNKQQDVINESLVYLKIKESNYDLYKSDVLGQWEQRLTTNRGWDWTPKWLPQLAQITYYSNDSSGDFSWLKMSLDGSEIDTLPSGQLLNPQLSPDAKWIYYQIQDGDDQHLKRMRLDGSADEFLTSGAGYNGRVTFSIANDQIAFISNRTGNNQLFLMDIATRKVQQLTKGAMIAKYSSFSPQGNQLAVCLAEPSEDPIWDIYIIDLETGEQMQLTNTPYAEQEIAWSLSGEKIAFHGSSKADGDQIYTINLANGKFTKVTSGDYYHGEPTWVSGY